MNLMVKPGVNWDPSKPKEKEEEKEILQPKPVAAAEERMSGLSVNAEGTGAGRRTRHSRAPSIVLSPSPSTEAPGAPPEKDILLTLDSSVDATTTTVETTYHTTVAKPEFWEKLLEFVR